MRKAGQSDWTPVRIDAVELGRKVEGMFSTFKNVACGVTLSYTAPTTADPQGYGSGSALMNEYFWSPKRFRIQYLNYQKPFWSKDQWGHKKMAVLSPVTEYLAVDGSEKRRLGSAVGSQNTNYSPKQGIFDVASDQVLVESYPTQFPKLIFSPFVGGNATLSRYLAALSKGVGGYKVATASREVLLGGRPVKQVRLYATRAARGKLPESTVEMIFQASAPFMPVTIHTTLGSKNELRWSGQWYNNANLDKVSPGGPFRIKQ